MASPSHRLSVFTAGWEDFTGTAGHFPFDPVGVYTIGFGHTMGVGPATGPWTRDHALNVLRDDMQWAADAVRRLVKVKLKQHEFDALCDQVYNYGEGAFASSTLLGLLNQGHRRLAAMQFRRWVYSNGVKRQGLVLRARARRRMFRRGIYDSTH